AEVRSEHLARHDRAGRLFPDQLDLGRFGGVAAGDRQSDLGTRRAARRRAATQPHALEYREVARGFAVDRADVVAGLQTGFRGRRIVARCDHAQVVLARQLDADITRRELLAALSSLVL